MKAFLKVQDWNMEGKTSNEMWEIMWKKQHLDSDLSDNCILQLLGEMQQYNIKILDNDENDE